MSRQPGCSFSGALRPINSHGSLTAVDDRHIGGSQIENILSLHGLLFKVSHHTSSQRHVEIYAAQISIYTEELEPDHTRRRS